MILLVTAMNGSKYAPPSPPRQIVRLADHLTVPALDVSNVCLVGESPACSVPEFYGYQGLRHGYTSYDYSYA